MDNLKIQKNILLKPYTSMYVGGRARYFIEVSTESEIISALYFAKERKLPVFVLGGGSNVIISDKGFNGLAIRISLHGKKKLFETKTFTDYKVYAGENWDSFVKFTVENNLYGIENMSHIPGSVGASVVQNIGCYGQEASETVLSVEAVDVKTLKKVTIRNKDINFSYRKSRFNDSMQDKGRFVIISVTFRLKKRGKLNMKYGDIKKYFLEHKNIKPSLQNIRKAVISIRDKKFPFPDSPKNGSVGSFWNAKTIDSETYEKIIRKLKDKGFDKKAEEMENKKSVFRVAQGFKVVPGLFIEVLGFKGKKVGGAKILLTHAGIINNFSGRATAKDVMALSKRVTDKVYNDFGLKLNIEPELVGKF